MTEGSITFLSVEDVIAIHDAVMVAFSPTEPRDILNPALLESAVLAPQQTFGGEYLYRSLEEIAAAYLIGLGNNHPFRQGNKRVALATAAVFLRRNGYGFTLNQEEAVALTMNAINHVWSQEEAVKIIQRGITLL